MSRPAFDLIAWIAWHYYVQKQSPGGNRCQSQPLTPECPALPNCEILR